MPGLTDQQFNDLQQGDLVEYLAGTDEDTYIEAEAVVANVDDERRIVVISLINIKEQGSLVDHGKDDQIMARSEELTIINRPAPRRSL